ncbi:3-isopropylmalate dehydratase [Melioribacteraceae bacterium 4301-Me]|uniref:LeuD/DmdB family oxidoreductase small subunit n=1 Tax=Pyranulibacter aquaticus TaxID=3163344 RepID=UPI003599D802
MEKIIKGSVFVLGDNIDTDQIIPAEHLVYSLTDEEESKKYGHFALSGVPLSQAGLPNGGVNFIEGDNYLSQFTIVIAGSNFGCGSSREHAPFALQKAGVKAVVAESYARIFYRNSVDGGFIIPLECNERLNDKIKTGDVVEINLTNYVLKNLDDGKEYRLKDLGDVLPIIQSGGLFEYARNNGMIV